MVKLFKETKNNKEQNNQETNDQEQNVQEEIIQEEIIQEGNGQEGNEQEEIIQEEPEQNDISIFEEYLKENGFENIKTIERNNIVIVIVGTNNDEIIVSNIINSFKQYNLYSEFTISIDIAKIKDTFFVFTPKDITDTDNINNTINSIVRSFKGFTEKDYYLSTHVKEIDGKNKSIIVFSKDGIDKITEKDVKDNKNYIKYKTTSGDAPISYFYFRGITDNPNITSNEVLFNYIKKIERTPVNLMSEFLNRHSLTENTHYTIIESGVYFFVILNRNKEINDQSISEYGLGNNLQGYATIQKDSSNEFTIFLINTNESPVIYPYLHDKNAKYYKMNDFYIKIVFSNNPNNIKFLEVNNKICKFNGENSYFAFLKEKIPNIGTLTNDDKWLSLNYCETLKNISDLRKISNEAIDKYDKDKNSNDTDKVKELEKDKNTKYAALGEAIYDLKPKEAGSVESNDKKKIIPIIERSPGIEVKDEFKLSDIGFYNSGSETLGFIGLYTGDFNNYTCNKESFCSKNNIYSNKILKNILVIVVIILVIVLLYFLFKLIIVYSKTRAEAYRYIN